MLKSIPPAPPGIPAVTTREMVEVDRLMIEEYGIRLEQMMEMAGRNLSDLTTALIAPKSRVVTVCVGTGNNGGGGMTAARHLANRGYRVAVYLIGDKQRLKPVPARRWQTLKKMNAVDCHETLPTADRLAGSFLIDAVIGYGLTGTVKRTVAEYVTLVRNDKPAFTLALDAPTGLDTTSGHFSSATLRANATMTLALPKTGLVLPAARPVVGDLYLADIGVPDDVLMAIGVSHRHIFSAGPILVLT